MKRNQSGDTIIEVMIAIVLLGAALGGAFAITNKSQLATQANHERYQAQLYANQQAELLRQAYTTYIATGNRPGFVSYVVESGTRCLDNAATVTTDSGCVKDGLYTIDVNLVENSVAGSADTSGTATKLNYSIVVAWDDLTGGQSRTELLYGL